MNGTSNLRTALACALLWGTLFSSTVLLADVATRDARKDARAEVARELRGGRAASAEGRDEDATDHLERAVAVAGERLPGTIDEANALDALAFHHLGAGRNERAAAVYGDALVAYRTLLGPDQPRVATTLHNLAVAEWRVGRIDDARAHAAAAVEIWDRLPAARRAGRDDGLQMLANLARRAGDEAEAARLEARRARPPSRD